jgi:hypothetical protein
LTGTAIADRFNNVVTLHLDIFPKQADSHQTVATATEGESNMNVIGINGSPQKEWNTATLVTKTLEGAAAFNGISVCSNSGRVICDADVCKI